MAIFLMITGCRELPVESQSTNKEIAMAMFDAFNRHDWQKMAGYYSLSAMD